MITQKMRKYALECIADFLQTQIMYRNNAHAHGQVQGCASMAFRVGLLSYQEYDGICQLSNRLYHFGAL